MRVVIVIGSSLAAAALLGCNPSTDFASLVGSNRLPPLADLKKEAIILGRSGGKSGEYILNIEVRPNNNVLVKTYHENSMSAPVAMERLQISPTKADGLRRILWRLRPGIKASDQNSVPIGCRYVYDAGSLWSVTFVRPDDLANLVVFQLPYPESCATPAYEEAKQLIQQVLGALPPSNVVRRFPAGRQRALGTYTP